MKNKDELTTAIDKAKNGEFVMSLAGSILFALLFTALIIYKLVKQKTRPLVWLQIIILWIGCVLNSSMLAVKWVKDDDPSVRDIGADQDDAG